MKISKKFKYRICKQAEDLLNIYYKPQGKSVDVFCISLYEPDDPQAEVTTYNYEFTVNITNNYSHTVVYFKYQGWCYDDIIYHLGTTLAIAHLNKHFYKKTDFYYGKIKEVE